MRKRILVIMLIIFSMFFATKAFADLGDFNDYSSDSGWDSSDWGGSSDSWDWDDDDDDDYYYYNGSSGGGGKSSGSPADFWLAVIVVAVIIIISMRKNKGGGSSSGGNVSSAGPEIKDNTNEIVKEIIKVDPNFSETRFISWVKEVFITLQTAWSDREFDKVRPFEKEELFNQHKTQIEGYIKNNRINVIERININNAHFFEYKRDNQYEYLTVFLKARMVDYIKDANTEQVLKGDPNRDCYPRYLLTFMRKKGVLTDAAVSNKSTTNCPNCGAPTQITSSGMCEYCGSVITTGDYDWVLSDIQGVKRNMTYGYGGVFISETDNYAQQCQAKREQEQNMHVHEDGTVHYGDHTENGSDENINDNFRD
ncbi:MAG: transporter [Firmicutes bacterium]|nr:transporter [Bacillota bacterium]